MRPPDRHWLHNAYHDTPALDLWRQGIELRLRRHGKRTLQTLKVLKAPLTGDRAPAGLHRLHEWEMPLAAGRTAPDVAALQARLPAGSGVRDALQRASAQTGFGERIGTHFRRTAWLLESVQGDLVEVALDIGEIRAAGQVLPLCEVELELKRGREHALFALAQALHASGLPLRIERRGKAERGLALLAGGATRPPTGRAAPIAPSGRAARTARAVRLLPGWPWPAALRTLVEECLAQVQGNEEGVVDGTDAEHVHQMRVGLRRLRAALGLFKGLAAPAQAVLADLRASARALGEARDAEVLAHETLARIPGPAQGRGAGDGAWPALRAAALGEAEAARRAAAQAVRSHRHAGWQLALMAWVSSLEDAGAAAPTTLPELAHHRLRRLRKRLLRLGRPLDPRHGEPDPAAWHAVRIAAKQLRYAAEMLGGVDGARGRRHAGGGAGHAAGATSTRALAALQDALGVLNDAQVAARRLQALSRRDPSLAAAAGFALGWLDRDARQRLRRLAKPWRRVRDSLRAARR